MIVDQLVARARRGVSLFAIAAVVAAACTPAAAPGLSEADRAAIAAVAASAQEAANAGNIEAWAAGYADDAVVMQPNGPAISGKAAIVEALKGFPPLSNVKFTQVTVEGAGEWAWVHGTYSMTATPPGAPAMDDRGKYLEVWRKHSDGTWKLYRDIYNSDLPLPGTP